MLGSLDMKRARCKSANASHTPRRIAGGLGSEAEPRPEQCSGSRLELGSIGEGDGVQAGVNAAVEARWTGEEKCLDTMSPHTLPHSYFREFSGADVLVAPKRPRRPSGPSMMGQAPAAKGPSAVVLP